MVNVLLALGAIASALAFGGVETVGFGPVEAAVVILAVVQFWRKGWPPVSRPTLWVLGILVAIPLVQLLPLPASLASAISPARVATARSLFSSLAPVGDKFALSVNSYETRLAVLKLTCYSLVFLLAFQTCRLRSERNLLIGTLILLGVLEALYGSAQYLLGWQYIFTYPKVYYTDVATGTYVNRNHYAGLLEMVLPFVLAKVLLQKPSQEGDSRSRWREMIISPGSSHLLRDMIVFAVIALGLVFSISRMGIIAAMVGVFLVVAIAFVRTRRRSALVTAFLIFSLPVAYSVWIGLSPVVERFEVLAQPGALDQERLPVWRDTIALIRDYPVLGTGLGTYRWANGHYQTQMLSSVLEHAHNDYLEFAADIGLPAAVLLFGSLWILLGKVSRRTLYLDRTKDRILAAGCAGAMMALLTHGIVDFNLQIPANAFIFAWIAGTAAALVRRPESDFSGQSAGALSVHSPGGGDG